MQAAFALTTIFAIALMASLALRFWLSSRQMRHVQFHRDAVPPAFQDAVSLTAHQKAADYTLAKGRLGYLSTAFGAAVLVGWTLLGGLDGLSRWTLTTFEPRLGLLGAQTMLLAAFALIGAALELPFDVYSTFCIEQRFGFNRMTWRLYATDLAKGAVVGIAVGVPLAAAILWIMNATGPRWWLWAWCAWSVFNIAALIIVPTVIAPLFNKFVPLDDASLTRRVHALMARAGFASKGLFVMDGSKRSAHANAYFTGFGASRRVVFFDTLLTRLTPPEVEAVLAHELGHFKLRHVTTRFVTMFALSLAAFALLGWLSSRTWFYAGLGVTPVLGSTNNAVALILFLLLSPVFGFFISPLFARMSRRHEFEADAFASRLADGSDLASALLKLHEDNASTLTPDPIFARFYYSHPPASERLAALPSASPARAVAAHPSIPAFT